jgi:hypothetical protein
VFTPEEYVKTQFKIALSMLTKDIKRNIKVLNAPSIVERVVKSALVPG